MNAIIWLCSIGGLFALLGLWTFVRGIVTGWHKILSTANDLARTLKDATEIARAYREDLAILRQIAQSGTTQNPENEPESIIPQKAVAAAMPAPYWGRYPIKPEEPDAPAESLGQVDVTASDEEVLEQERNSAALDFEVQERQKAATREADQVRLKELADLSGEEK